MICELCGQGEVAARLWASYWLRVCADCKAAVAAEKRDAARAELLKRFPSLAARVAGASVHPTHAKAVFRQLEKQSQKEAEERAKAEYDRILYASSEGVDEA